MTSRLTLFKWRARARRIAETTTDPAVQAIAAQFHAGIDSLLVLRTEDRTMKPKFTKRGGGEHWAWVIANSVPLAKPRATLYTIADVTDPTKFPDPAFRVTALMQVFAAVMAGLIVITENVQQVFRRTATDDPDPRVRAWAHFLIDPKNHPRPDEE